MERVRHRSRAMGRGFEIHVLDGVNVWSFTGSGYESFAVVRYTGFMDGGLSMGSVSG